MIGPLKLGFVTELLSLPIRHGFLNGVIVTIIVEQLPKLLGYKDKGESFFEQVRDLIGGIAASRHRGVESEPDVVRHRHARTQLILLFKRFWPRIPGVLIAVSAATALVWFMDRGAGVATVGNVPRGLPRFELPLIPPDQWWQLAGPAAAIALVSFTDVSVLSRIYELRNQQKVDGSQECVAPGLSKIAEGLMQGLAVSASGSRTPVAEAAGAKTQVTGVFAAGVVALLLALVLVLAPHALSHTPQSALAAVVIAACLGMLEIHGVVGLYRLRKSEFVQALVYFVGVVMLGVVDDIALELALTKLSFLCRARRPYDAVLGRIDGRDVSCGAVATDAALRNALRHVEAGLLPVHNVAPFSNRSTSRCYLSQTSTERRKRVR